MVPVESDGTVVLVRQYRRAVAHSLLEIPAGLLDQDGESPMEAARRELAEEVGLTASQLDPLVTYRPSAGFSNETVHVFLATGLEPLPGHQADPDLEEVVRMPFAHALEAVRSGAIADGKTIIGLLLADDHRRG